MNKTSILLTLAITAVAIHPTTYASEILSRDRTESIRVHLDEKAQAAIADIRNKPLSLTDESFGQYPVSFSYCKYSKPKESINDEAVCTPIGEPTNVRDFAQKMEKIESTEKNIFQVINYISIIPAFIPAGMVMAKKLVTYPMLYGYLSVSIVMGLIPWTYMKYYQSIDYNLEFLGFCLSSDCSEVKPEAVLKNPLLSISKIRSRIEKILSKN